MGFMGKKAEEEATKRFLNPSATNAWPDGEGPDEYESEEEVQERVKKKYASRKEHKMNIKSKITIPNGNGNGKCLVCGQPVKADTHGYFGDRVDRFFCVTHGKTVKKSLSSAQ